MKKLLIILVVLILFCVGVLGFVGWSNNNISKENLQVTGQQASAIKNIANSPTPAPAEQDKTRAKGIPIRIQIPSIKVDAQIEKVGVDSQNRMDVPKDADNVGWFSLGFKPGEIGNAVLDGHLDKATGAPAVFWDLGKLKAGDEITILDSNDNKQVFIVTGMSIYPYNKFPLDEVFGAAKKSRLNLITCNGTWDKTAKNYSQRIVVFSELK